MQRSNDNIQYKKRKTRSGKKEGKKTFRRMCLYSANAYGKQQVNARTQRNRLREGKRKEMQAKGDV